MISTAAITDALVAGTEPAAPGLCTRRAGSLFEVCGIAGLLVELRRMHAIERSPE